MDLSSFLTSLGTSLLVFLVLVLLFTWLSGMPANEVVYYPNRVLKEGLMGTTCSSSSSTRSRICRCPSFLGWVVEAVGSPEEDVIAMAGVDAAVYLLFLRTGLVILSLSGVLLLPALIPVAATDNNFLNNELKNGEPGATSGSSIFTDLDKLAMGNVKERSPRLWAFLLGTYWVTFVSFSLLWKAYKHASSLRAAAKASARVKPEDLAVLVRDIPPAPQGQTRKEQVDSFFRALYPETFYRSMVITDNKQAKEIWDELEGCRKKLARAEALLVASSKTATSEPDGTRPTHRTGFLGIVGTKVDTIDKCNARISDLLHRLENEQKLTLREKQEGAALVFFSSRAASASASQTLHAQIANKWTVTEAPEPRDLLWSNLGINGYGRQVRRCAVYVVVFLTVVFYMVPIGLISAITTLENLRKLLPFLKVLVDRQPVLKTVLEAYLPQLALIVFMALLPKFLTYLSRAEGLASESDAVRGASGKYFYFIVFNVFLGVTVGGTLFSSLKTLEKHPNQIVPMLGENLPGNAAFFLTFVALKFLVGYGLELSRLVPLVLYHAKKKFLCKSTEEELREAWAPGDLGYATRVPNDMLVMTIVLCYSVIAPLIIPFGVLYFGIGWLVLRNQALRVYAPSYESNGRMWPHMHTRIVAALMIYQTTMIGYLGVKKFYYAPLLMPLPLLSLIFSSMCNTRFYPAFSNTPLEVACRNAGVDHTGGRRSRYDLELAYAAYIPPFLFADKSSDYDQFEDALSHASRTPSFESQPNIGIGIGIDSV